MYLCVYNEHYRETKLALLINSRFLPIVNPNILQSLSNILAGINVVDEVERLADMYCEIVDIVHQVNTLPPSKKIKSARM